MRGAFGWGRGASWLFAGLTLAACGDSGRAEADGSGSVSMTQTDPTTPTSTVPTGTASMSSTDSDDGTNSNSATQSTPATATDSTAGPGTDPTATGTEGTLSTTDSTTNPGTLTATSGTDTTATATTSDVTTGDPCEGGMGGFDFSYLWVANTDQGSISKINTMSLVEEARYFVDPVQSGVANTSRTSVNIDGRFVVVSNRDTGTVTKVAANVDDCVDKNANATIETSPNKDTLLPWGQDECVLWNTQVNAPFSGGAGPRATAWAPGDFNPMTCKYDNQKVWIGWLTGPGQAVMGRLDGATGMIEGTAPLPGWPLTADQNNGYAPYGAAADAQGYIWTTAVFSGLAYRIDPITLEVTSWQSPMPDSHYGMTVDNKGRVWFANYGGGHGEISVFDPANQTWATIPGTGNNLYRGIAVDSEDQVWVASNAGGTNGCGMMQADGNTLTAVQFHTFPQCSTPVGISIDVDGDVWMVDYAGWAYEIDPITYAKTLVPIANVHYTYSDMTGGGLKNAVTPQ